MKRLVIGYIFFNRKLGKDEKFFIKEAKKKKIDLILINLEEEIDEKKILEKIKYCDIIYNNSAEQFAIEIVKTIEELGKKVIDSSKTYYYTEDKWMFYLKCKESGIPTPETSLLSENINEIEKELLIFNHFPVILKRIEGTCGEYVEKANTPKQAIKIIKKFWKKGSERLPIIAQEFIKSPSYRVTVIGGKIVQTAIKKNKGSWKSTGVYEKKFQKFKVDKELKKIINKVIRVMKINVCGIDLLKKDNQWKVLEINSTPGLDFFKNEREMLVGKILDLLKKKAKRK